MLRRDFCLGVLLIACFFIFSYQGCALIGDVFQLDCLGNYQYQLKVNIGDYSNIDVNDAYIIGWEDNEWDELIPTSLTDKPGWIEVTLTAKEPGIKKFGVTNGSQTEWLWLANIYHPLVIPSVWLDSNANVDDLIIAFKTDGPDGYKYIQRQNLTTTITEPAEVFQLTALGDFQFRLAINIKDYSDIYPQDAYVLGWENQWENQLSMNYLDENGWAEIILTANSRGPKSFSVCNFTKDKWLEIGRIDDPFVIPNIWLNSNSSADDLVVAFNADSGTWSYIGGPVDLE